MKNNQPAILVFTPREEEKEYILQNTKNLPDSILGVQYYNSLFLPFSSFSESNEFLVICSLAFSIENLIHFAKQIKIFKKRKNFCAFLVGSFSEEEKAWQLCPQYYYQYFIYEAKEKRLLYCLTQWLRSRSCRLLAIYSPSMGGTLKKLSKKRLLQAAYDSFPSPLLILKAKNYKLVEYNSATLSFFGCTSKQEFEEYYFPQIRREVKKNKNRIIAGIKDVDKVRLVLSITLQKTNQEDLFIALSINHFYLKDERYLLVALLDNSRIKEAEDALAQSEARFRAMVQNSSDVIAILAADSTIIFVSSSSEFVLGFKAEELIGISFFSQVYSEDVYIVKSTFLSALQNAGQLFRAEFRFVQSNGNVNYLDCLFVNYLENTALRGIVLNIRDITQRKLTELALAESQERLDLAIWAANLALWDWHILSGKVYRNEKWQQLLEYSASEIAPTFDFWKEHIHPEDHSKVMNLLEKHFSGEISFFQVEYRLRKKSGEWIWVLDSGKVVDYTPTGKPKRATGTLLDISERKFFEEQKKKQQLAILNALIEGQDQERKRIAAELHDGLGQQLHAIKLHFYLLTQTVNQNNTNSVETTLVTEISQMINQAIQEVRDISHNLMPKTLQDFGLKVAIQNLCDYLQNSQAFNIVLDASHLPEHLPSSLEASIYRIIQEAFSNIIKHAQAKKVIIQLWVNGRILCLLIEDDGLGFSIAEIQERKGIGLMNLETRVKLLQGNLTLDSCPGGGTTILVEIPIIDS
ncbi:MAG: PAS domain-containing protein [Bacteroidia bacterium]|nr:PAS domain-containing protein [Bacteroidia bacterium]MDW8157706.1 PAS domain-containing protein [Bacteroidia bacterium]